MRSAAGFTLVELLVTLVLVGILVGLGVPAMRGLIAPAAMQSWVTSYHMALRTTRHMAVSANRGVTLCALDDNGRCTGQWDRRLALFFDPGRTGQLQDAADLITHTKITDGENIRVTWRGFGERRFLHVRANGSYRQNGRFTFCGQTAAPGGQGRQIVVNVTGRTRVEPAACDGG
ncbi:MAG: GspH/FimT family protein [Gammaproteobacteria bacterium]